MYELKGTISQDRTPLPWPYALRWACAFLMSHFGFSTCNPYFHVYKCTLCNRTVWQSQMVHSPLSEIDLFPFNDFVRGGKKLICSFSFMKQEPRWGGCSQLTPHYINYMYLALFENPRGESGWCACSALSPLRARSCDFTYYSLNSMR